MPRRKKKVKETSEVQNLEKKDVETTSPVNVKRKRKLEDAFIVISDSDGEVSILKRGALGLKLDFLNQDWFVLWLNLNASLPDHVIFTRLQFDL